MAEAKQDVKKFLYLYALFLSFTQGEKVCMALVRDACEPPKEVTPSLARGETLGNEVILLLIMSLPQAGGSCAGSLDIFETPAIRRAPI
jgi:hypothetical protein